MTEDEIANACPVCLGNCNCKSCLRLDAPIKVCNPTLQLVLQCVFVNCFKCTCEM
jgi:hypothetical protein